MLSIVDYQQVLAHGITENSLYIITAAASRLLPESQWIPAIFVI